MYQRTNTKVYVSVFHNTSNLESSKMLGFDRRLKNDPVKSPDNHEDPGITRDTPYVRDKEGQDFSPN